MEGEAKAEASPQKIEVVVSGSVDIPELKELAEAVKQLAEVIKQRPVAPWHIEKEEKHEEHEEKGTEEQSGEQKQTGQTEEQGEKQGGETGGTEEQKKSGEQKPEEGGEEHGREEWRHGRKKRFCFWFWCREEHLWPREVYEAIAEDRGEEAKIDVVKYAVLRYRKAIRDAFGI